MIPNVLAQRYASTQITKIFEPKNKFRSERLFWVNVLKLQQNYGLEVSNKVIQDYVSNLENIDLESIEKRELKSKHDVKARIEEFNSLAGHEFIHIGLTSRDVTDNVELIQIMEALRVIQIKTLAFLQLLAKKIEIYKEKYVVGRTHNVPAQITTIGKKFAILANEVLQGYRALEYEIESFKFKGIKGAIGSNQDGLQIFKLDDLQKIELELAQMYGFSKLHSSVGQVYPRSQDYSFISKLLLICSGASSFALDIRLMAGLNHARESTVVTQTGSSAMPHKFNPRSSERINSLMTLIRGYSSIAAEISGNQWNEGDVSCSVVRRVIIPDVFFATDGILNTIYNIVENLIFNEEQISEDLMKATPFMCSSTILMRLVKKGLGREKVHNQLKNIVRNNENNSEAFKSQIKKEFAQFISSTEFDSIFEDFKVLSGSSTSDCEKTYSEISKLIKTKSENAKFEMKF